MLHFRSFSQVILCGRLSQDARLQNTKSGTSMLIFSVATSVSVKNRDGSYENASTFHDCLLFGSRAQKLAETLKKGTIVCVQGSISYREVDLTNGYKGRSASIAVEDLQILALPHVDQGTQTHAGTRSGFQAKQPPQDSFIEHEELPC